MYTIATLNKISPKGLALFTEDYEIVPEAEAAQGILVRSQDMQEMEFSPGLLAIARAGAGVNNIPVTRCADQGIVVFNTPGANANAVKELVLTALLITARNLTSAIAWTQTLTDDISKTVEKNKSQFAGHEIKGKTLGVIGLGAIGVLVANAAEDLGMKVIGYDPYLSVKGAHQLHSTIAIEETLDKLLPFCDYVTIHVPFMESTKGMIDAKCFELMKEGACLLNFSRDKLVDENALLEAIEKRKIRDYVTDFPNDKIAGKEHITCIPHLGASTAESEENCARMAVEELMDYIENGNINNSVNYPECSLGRCTTTARIVVLNKNIPAMLGKITGILADMNINIDNLVNRSKGDYACTLVDVDSPVEEEALKKALLVEEGIISVRVISK
ncbi:MAG: 3-phosphoglycerate dehydrogenase family protein [Bacillota bacterium]|nr:3-phosphoglycerate dehydrogenase family protein [Bacillota bacterium]